MIDAWETAIWLPHTPGLGLRLLLPQNVFLLHAQDEQFFKDGSVFHWGRKNWDEIKIIGATTCFGGWSSPAGLTFEEDDLISSTKSYV